MITPAQTLATRPPMAFAPFSGLISNLIASTARSEQCSAEQLIESDLKKALRQIVAGNNGRSYAKKVRDKRRAEILAILIELGGATPIRVAEKLGIFSGTGSTSKHLREMLADGIVQKSGEGRSAKWSAVK